MEDELHDILIRLAVAPLTVGVAFIWLALSLFGSGCSVAPASSFSPCVLTGSEYAFRAALLAAGVIALGLGVGLVTQVVVERRRSGRHGARPKASRSPVDRSAPTSRRMGITAIAVGVAAVTVVVLVLVPVPQGFTVHNGAIYDVEVRCTGLDTVPGTTVSFDWSAPSFTHFAVVSCSGNQAGYRGNGTSGSGSFVSGGGIYEFGAVCVGVGPCIKANVSGTYTAPFIPT